MGRVYYSSTEMQLVYFKAQPPGLTVKWSNGSMCPIDATLTNTTTSGQSWPGGNGNEGIHYIHQSPDWVAVICRVSFLWFSVAPVFFFRVFGEHSKDSKNNWCHRHLYVSHCLELSDQVQVFFHLFVFFCFFISHLLKR